MVMGEKIQISVRALADAEDMLDLVRSQLCKDLDMSGFDGGVMAQHHDAQTLWANLISLLQTSLRTGSEQVSNLLYRADVSEDSVGAAMLEFPSASRRSSDPSSWSAPTWTRTCRKNAISPLAAIGIASRWALVIWITGLPPSDNA